MEICHLELLESAGRFGPHWQGLSAHRVVRAVSGLLLPFPHTAAPLWHLFFSFTQTGPRLLAISSIALLTVEEFVV